MSDKISEDLNSVIQAAVKSEVAKLLQSSIASEVEAAERGIAINPLGALGGGQQRYVIYWTARQQLL